MDYRESYASWRRDFASDTQLMAELDRIAGDEKEIEDRFYKELSFGTAGMRGVLGAGLNRMNVYNVRRATRGLAKYLLKDPGLAVRGVAIAYDSRRMSPEFAKETALVLCQSGVPAYLFDALRPVPILSFAVRHLSLIAGVAITASHNPPQYNGYKVYGEDGAQLGPEAAQGVTDCIQETAYYDAVPMDEGEALKKGLLHIIGNSEVDDDYIRRVRTLCVQPQLMKEEGGKLSIVYTPLHGSGNVPVRRILKEVGITNVAVVKEQEQPDPNFSTISVPNPEDPAAYKLAMELANQVGADVIFGTDPDCDRLGVAVRDKTGHFQLLTGNQIGCVLLHYILSTRKKLGTLPENGAAVKSIVTTELARAICMDFGVSIFDTLTGFKFIGELIQQFEDTGSHTFLFGFEESYGYLSSTFVRDKDGVNASLLLAEAAVACKAEGITLYDRVQDIFKRYGYYVEKVVSKTLPGKDGLEKMQKIMAGLRTNPPRELAGIPILKQRDYLTGISMDTQGNKTHMGLPESDVLYYELSGGHWVCIRPSGTEPKIKLYVNTCAREENVSQALNDALIKSSEALLS
jgi:phosphoglucomutase